jgi:ribosomal protein L34
MWITFCQEHNQDQNRQDTKSLIQYFLMQRLTKNNKTKAKRKYGFLERMASHGGQKVLKRRRAKQRTRLSA